MMPKANIKKKTIDRRSAQKEGTEYRRKQAGTGNSFVSFRQTCVGWDANGAAVRAGSAHARRNGKRLGRPVTAALHADRVQKRFRRVVR